MTGFERASTLTQYFGDRVAVGDGCWSWLAAHDDEGYSLAHFRERRTRGHRIAYELFVGPIPDGLTIDHLCRNKGCVRPSHLEPATIKENSWRGGCISAVNASKTHCKYGHEFDDANTITHGPGYRICRACKRIDQLIRRATGKNNPQLKAKITTALSGDGEAATPESINAIIRFFQTGAGK